MSGEKFNLAWSDFDTSALQTLRDLLVDTDFVDVTLASHDDEQIKAHKVILCSASPFFKRILLKNPHQNPLLYLRNVDIKTLKSIINFIYIGETQVEQDELETFFAIAKDLEIKGLSNESFANYKEQQNDKKKVDVLSHPETSTFYDDSAHNSMLHDAPKHKSIFYDDSEHKPTLHDDGPFNEEVIERFSKDNFLNENRFETEPLEVKFIQRPKTETKVPSLTMKDPTGRYPCNKCDYKATSQSRLKIHANAIHEGVRYPCNHCEYKATQKSSLNRHMIRHSLV